MTIIYVPTEKGSTSADELKDELEEVLWKYMGSRQSFNEVEGYFVVVQVEAATKDWNESK